MVAAGNSLNISSAGLVKFDGTATFTGVTVTQFDVLVAAAANGITSVGPGTAGQVLQSGGAASNPAYSTPTYPSISGTSGKVLISNGTNNVYSTPTFPNASATAGKFIQSDGTNWLASTPTLPTTAGTTGTILRSDGTNLVNTTSTYPNTNAVSTLLYASSANVMAALATANDGVLITSNTGVPSWLAAGTTGQVLTATTGSPATWATPIGTGDVVGPAGATDNALVRYDGPTGKLIQNSSVILSDAGQMTNSSQPVFFATAAAAANATGNGAIYQYGTSAMTEVIDQGNVFNTNGTFTTPITGTYFLSATGYLEDCTTNTGVLIRIVTSNRTYNGGVLRGASDRDSTGCCIAIADMDAADTAVCTIIGSGEAANTDDLLGVLSSITYSYFNGYLIC